LFVGLFIGLIGLFIPLIAEQGQNLALLDIEQLQYNIQDLYNQVVAYFEFNNIDVEQSIKDSGLLSKLDFAYIP
ncbi:AI-2E family transporter, partial [Maribacter flavus]|nr:AI-2E family transporter [Maribacter flavus]